MFVCVFAKKFPALASQSCCDVSRPRAVGEYEYRLFELLINKPVLGVYIGQHFRGLGYNMSLSVSITN